MNLDTLSWQWNDDSQSAASEETERPHSYSEIGIEAFRSDNWDKMTDEEKMSSLQGFSDDYASEIGLSTSPTLVPENNPNLYGGYVSSTNQIRINLDACANPYEAVDTVVHEDNHAYQEESIKAELAAESRYSEAEKAVLKSENGAGYVRSGIGYDAQALELDSNTTAFQYVSERFSSMSDDPAFYDYATGRDEHFHEINSYMANNTESVNLQESGQVEKSFSCGEISEEERDIACETIENGNTSFRGASAEAGQAAHQSCIDSSLSKAGQLHSDFQNNSDTGNGTINVEENQKCIGYLKEGLEQSQTELAEAKAQASNYIVSNNMGIREVASDETCREYRAQIEACEQKVQQFDYHVTELSTDIELANSGSQDQSSHDQDGQDNSQQSESSGMDNGQSM